jgi:hypothetical protein
MSKNSETKCIAVHLPISMIDKINELKSKTGKGQGGTIIDLLEKGLDISKEELQQNKVFFFVKVRIDTSKMLEFGQKLQSGELNTSNTIATYCINDDPEVGLSFWQSDSTESFEEVFAKHKPHYKDIIEVIPMITPGKAMTMIMAKMRK